MKDYLQLFLFMMFFSMLNSGNELMAQQPPFDDTAEEWPNLITNSDTSTFSSLNYIDIHTEGSKQFYKYQAIYNDGISLEIRGAVNIGGGQWVVKQDIINNIARPLGRLPKFLRMNKYTNDIILYYHRELNGARWQVWSQKKSSSSDGSSISFVYTLSHDAGVTFSNIGNIEEVLMHEAVHASIQGEIDFEKFIGNYTNFNAWANAANADGNHISKYATTNWLEDMAESFNAWFAVRFRPNAISAQDRQAILNTIPNRLAFFDNQNYDMSFLSTANMSSPANGSTINSSSAYFVWNTVPNATYFLAIQAPGYSTRYIYYNSPWGNNRYVYVQNLPIQASYIQVRLYTTVNGQSHSKVYTYNTPNSLRTQLVGIEDPPKTEADKLIYYPNPASDLITVKTPEFKAPGTITIHDLRGSVVYRTKLTKPSQQIEVSEIPDGTYIISVKSEGISHSGQLIIKK